MKKLILLAMILTLLAIATSPVLGQGVGTIRIEPHSSYYGLPTMLDSPATFNISVQPGGDPTCYPHILLVITNDTYDELIAGGYSVTVNWTEVDIITITPWIGPETDPSKKIPYEPYSPSPLDSGVGYTVASLKDHLKTTHSIYWAFEPFLGASLNQTPQEFTVTVTSPNPIVLVSALGKIGTYDSEGNILCPDPTDPFTNRVPPTQPGFVVPELAAIFLMVASFGAFALYMFSRRKILHPK